MNKYWAFGLHILSEIQFPEFLPALFDEADIFISFGTTPEKIEGEDVIHGVQLSVSPNEYLLKINNIATYYVNDGQNIIVQPAFNADIDTIRLFLLSNAMAAVLHQRNSIPFHASGIILNDEVILFTGRSGAGKSTTIFSLIQDGYELFNDDVCVLNYNEATRKVEAVASYPMIKLWENTINEIVPERTERHHKLRPDLPKYGFFQHEKFSQRSFPISRVFILKTDNLQDEFTCIELNKIAGFNALQQNTYRRRQVDMMQIRQHHFEMISRLANQAVISEIKRPMSGSDISDFISFIKAQLPGNGKG